MHVCNGILQFVVTSAPRVVRPQVGRRGLRIGRFPGPRYSHLPVRLRERVVGLVAAAPGSVSKAIRRKVILSGGADFQANGGGRGWGPYLSRAPAPPDPS